VKISESVVAILRNKRELRSRFHQSKDISRSSKDFLKESSSVLRRVKIARTGNYFGLRIHTHLRPYLSAAKPKMMDPTDLNIKTNVIPQDISVLVFSKVLARSDKVKLTVKKSNASQD